MRTRLLDSKRVKKRTMGSGSSWGKKGQGDQAAVGVRKDKGIRQQLG